MPAKPKALKFKRTIDASPSDVYRAFTNATAIREWMCNAAQVDARKGGRVYLWWNDGAYTSGEFTTLTPDKTVSFTWSGRGEPDATRVRVSLKAKNGSTVVNVTHTGMSGGKKWADTVRRLESGWEAGLENLQSVLETGQDLRFMRQPMLGVLLDQFDADIAAKLGVPTTEGSRLAGTVEGMGAQAAGLQKDDVITAIGRKKIASFSDLGGALRTHRAGDTVKVKFYRGSEQMTTDMTLSGRPIPEIPKTARELAEAVGKIYDDLDTKLDHCFAGVSDEEAARKPADDEWSAKETLAHLITAERDTQFWLAGVMTGQETPTFPNNSEARYAATISVFPTVIDMLQELKRSEAETTAMLAALPDDFLEHNKGSYWRIGNAFIAPPSHAETHVAQVQAAIDAARNS